MQTQSKHAGKEIESKCLTIERDENIPVIIPTLGLFQIAEQDRFGPVNSYTD
jgi:hypothetical protein